MKYILFAMSLGVIVYALDRYIQTTREPVRCDPSPTWDAAREWVEADEAFWDEVIRRLG